MKANQFDEEKAAANYHLPIEAVREALAYVEENRELLETETEIERLMLKRGGVARGPCLQGVLFGFFHPRRVRDPYCVWSSETAFRQLSRISRDRGHSSQS